MAFNAQTIALALRLETGQFTAGLGMAGARVRAFAGDVKKAGSDTGAAFSEAAQRSDKGFKTMSTGALVAGGAIVAGFGLAVMAATNFDKQMSEVGAVAGATSGELGELRQAALDAGQATVFSASQAAQAEAELAKAGVSTRDILAGGLTGALDLAAAGSLDLASAAEIAANAMNIFQLEGGDVTHIADLLAAAANKSATDVAEMGMALKQGGGQAQLMGLSVEDTVGSLALFAQYALKGSDGGTALKTMLQRLTPQSAEAKAMMDGLGISFYDANGEFIGMSATAEVLKTKLGGLSEEQRNAAMNTIFGADASRAASALMNEGAAGVDEWTRAVNESGYAAELAGEKNDNLAGDLEQLKGSIETALIQGGSQATTALRFLAGGITDVVNGLNGMPGPIQTAFLGATGVVGAASLGVGAMGRLTPAVKEFKEGLEQAGAPGKFLAGNLGAVSAATAGLGIALTGVALIYGHYAAQEAAAEQRAKEFTDTLNEQTGAVTENTAAKVQSTLEDNNRMDNLNQAGISVQAYTDAIADNTDAMMSQGDVMARFNPGMKGAEADNRALAASLREQGGARNELIATLLEQGAADAGLIGQIYEQTSAYDANQAMLHERAVQQGIATGKTREQAEADIAAKEAAEQHTQAIKDAADALRAATDPYYAAWRAQQQLTEAQGSYNLAVRDHGPASQEAIAAYVALTDAGFGYEGSLLDLAAAQSNGDASAADLAARLEALKAYGIDPTSEAARGAGWDFLGLAVAAQIADDKNVEIPVRTPGLDEAIAKAGTLADLYDRLNKPLPSYMNPNAPAYGAGYGVLKANGGLLDFYAAGGIRDAEYFANGSENHIAQIAPAGSWRVWAEPETGGEAYIPFAASKRTRSVSIWREVGNRLGVGQGGTSVALSYAPSFSFPNYLGDRRDLEQAMRAVLRDNKTEVAAIVRQVVKAGS